VPKKKIGNTVVAGPSDYLQRTPKPPTNFMQRNKDKYSDGRKNAFTKVGYNGSILDNQEDGIVYTMPDTANNLRANNPQYNQGYN